MPALASLLHEFCAAVDQPIVFVDLNLRVLQTNQAFRDQLHVKADEVEQAPLFSLPDGTWNGPELQRMLCEQERQPYGVFASSEIAWTLGQSTEETVCVSVYFVTEFENDEPTEILIAIRRQTGAQEDSSKLAEIGKLLSQATAIPAPGLYFRQILELCLFAVCEMTGWPIGHFWLIPEEKNKRFVPSDVWRCPENSETSHLRQATRTAGVSSEPGFPEQVVQTRQLIWLDELAHFDDSHRREILQSLGSRTAIGVPVHVGGRARAVLEFFDTKSVPRSTEIVRFCTQICQLAGR
ncbi:MAG TPA: GAF domain-containing protein, partial [Planctomycetaceae bacterium]|nr:GAF domain-containing protein [Planctomycetaceae bacterium]